jgi:hypothetical protein
VSNELQGKDRELQTVNITMADRMDKKQKEIDQLRDNARASGTPLPTAFFFFGAYGFICPSIGTRLADLCYARLADLWYARQRPLATFLPVYDRTYI